MEFLIFCILIFCNVIRAKEALYQCLPDQLRDSTFTSFLGEDRYIKHWLQQLLKNLEPQSDQVMAVFESKKMLYLNSRPDFPANNQIGKEIHPHDGMF